MSGEERTPENLVDKVSRRLAEAAASKVEEIVQSMLDSGITPTGEYVETLRRAVTAALIAGLERQIAESREKSVAERRRLLEETWSEYYDRDGTPMTLQEWAADLDRHTKKRVAEDDVGDYWVSTVWLGLNHSFGTGPPLIFETMVFGRDEAGNIDYGELFCDRYSTEEEAKAGHEAVVAALRSGVAVDDLSEMMESS